MKRTPFALLLLCVMFTLACPPPVPDGNPTTLASADDVDGDGIPNKDDACPEKAEDKDTFQDDDGCPDLDNDQDGFPDRNDPCPNLAGNTALDGCPRVDKDPAMLTSEALRFEEGKATINPKGRSLLEQVAKAVKDDPGNRQLQIAGHADDSGDDTYNLGLSERRAKAVYDALVSIGVDPQRLVVQAWGRQQPIRTTTGLEGRSLQDAQAENRRVEFRFLGL
ncbi:MAG: OmpA family protein [Myxococcota bacterium]